MISQMSHVMTLANSIIGVSVLAMPFCFKQCGILLAIVVLLVSSILSRLACHFLVKSAVMSRRRNFELLAFHAFGHMGKFLVELFIIGFLVGTCIAFFVVVGDLGPQIVGKLVDKNPEDIRTSLLITTSVFIVLPLGLFRNIDSLSSICTATIAFYLCLVLKVMAESMQHIFAGDWYEHVYYWRPSGILQCLPIFSMALFCQTQLFEIYETIPNVSLEKMNQVVRGALNICTVVYLCVGFFGYVAFCTQSFSGNILMSFQQSLSSDMIKMGFVFSVAFSFPLVIFPCRASLNSLLFRRVYTHEPSMNYLPETRFRCLTIAIITVSLITGILIPNIEFVLGLVGSTIGVMICLIFPAVFFISISSKHTNERLLAQTILFIGICIMILGTYANLYAMEESSNAKAFMTTNKPLSQINNLPLSLNKENAVEIPNIAKNPEILPNAKEKVDQSVDNNIPEKVLQNPAKDVRQEPPVPVERVVVTEKSVAISPKSVDSLIVTFAPEIKEIVEKIKSLSEKSNKNEQEPKEKKQMEQIIDKVAQPLNVVEEKPKLIDNQLINSDALKKEDSELAAAADADNMRADERREELWKTLEKHKLEQLKMMREQKEILKDIRQQKKEIERDKQKIAKGFEEVETAEKHQLLAREKLNSNEIVNPLEVNVQEDKNKPAYLTAKITKVLSQQISEVKDSVRLETPDLNVGNEGSNMPKLIRSVNQEPNKNDQEELKVLNIKRSSVKNNLASNKQESGDLKINYSRDILNRPIVNTLTKRTLQKLSVGQDVGNNETKKSNEIDKKEGDMVSSSDKVEVKTADQRMQDQFPLPIALKMRNQTKLELSSNLVNGSQEDAQLFGRDILQSHDREKRDAELETQTKITNENLYTKVGVVKANATIDADTQKCSKPKLNIEQHEENVIGPSKLTVLDSAKTYTTQTSLIKTNIYLADQEVANAIAVDPSVDLRGEFVKVKQRDLKAVNDN